MPYEPVLLANIRKPNSHTLAVYEAGGGYRGLRRALKEMAPKDMVEMVKSSGLRGRGGAGFPTGLKWSFLPEKHAGPVYLCVNADESEPGTFVNRVQMELDPHQVLEGIILSCYATRASTAYIYLRYEYPLCRKRMQAAIDECLRRRLLGQEHSRQRILARRVHPSRRGGLRLRRRNRTDREHRRPPGVAADQAALPSRRRVVPQADRRQQRRNAGLRQAHRRSRRGVVPLDGHAARAGRSPRSRQFRPETLWP